MLLLSSRFQTITVHARDPVTPTVLNYKICHKHLPSILTRVAAVRLTISTTQSRTISCGSTHGTEHHPSSREYRALTISRQCFVRIGRTSTLLRTLLLTASLLAETQPANHVTQMNTGNELFLKLGSIIHYCQPTNLTNTCFLFIRIVICMSMFRSYKLL